MARSASGRFRSVRAKFKDYANDQLTITATGGILRRVSVPEESTSTLSSCSFGLQPLALDPHRLAHRRVGFERRSQDCLRKQERVRHSIASCVRAMRGTNLTIQGE
jgi:hypothetical protein